MAKKTVHTDKTLARWRQARFGMFIHWGLYSAGNLDCWKMNDMGIPVDEYARELEPKFRGKNFDAATVVKLAKNAGCKYIVMGTRHHEGYCLWDTATTTFSSVHGTPRRDFIAEYVQAARSAGLMVGFYYSFLDWRNRAYWEGPRKNPQAWKRFVAYVHAQVRELMSNYGKIDILWYDGAWGPTHLNPWGVKYAWGFKPDAAGYAQAWQSAKLNAMVRQLQPGILINDRSYLPEDFGTPEKTITPEHRPWELCDTIGFYWGASSRDRDRKSPRTLLDRLIYCVSRNGNMLLNVGPKPDGRLMAWQQKTMLQLGRWLKKHDEAIYGCGGEWQNPFNNPLAPWYTTRKNNTLYIHLLRYPGESFGLANHHDYHLLSARLLDTGKKLKIIHEPMRDIISGLPKQSPDPLACIVKVKIREKTPSQIKARKWIGIEEPNAI
ncbi:MAG: alpha-L-fucosidase [Sedimentisphaerales bacterium]|nr:alpha-L-fucosidase [Sedimentisphaerales bacterium]